MSIQDRMRMNCTKEFGPNHEHSDIECEWLLDAMSPEMPDSGWNDTWYDNMNTSGAIGFSVFN